MQSNGILDRAGQAREAHLQGEQNDLNYLDEADAEIERLSRTATGGGAGGGDTKPALSIGGVTIKANGTGGEALKEKYGQSVTGYSATYDVQAVLNEQNVIWQLFYDDLKYVYLITSECVPNKILPASGETVNGVTYGNEDLNGMSDGYKVKFNRGWNTYEYVCSNGTKYADGSASSAILENPLTTSYLNWVESYPDKTSRNMRCVAFMMDTEKWSMYADNNIEGAFAIGGPTLELFIKSYNAYEGHSEKKISTYDDGITSNNANGYGYWVKWDNQPSWNTYIDGMSNASNDLWIRSKNYFLASPWAQDNGIRLGLVQSNGGIYGGYDYYDDCIRPVVAIPKSSIK